MIKVIISHDVDHLYAKDHWLRDMIYPKLWVRTTLEFFRKEITLKEWWGRNTSCFRKNRHNIEKLMDFDRKYGVPSTFFFGMNQGLGMSYKPNDAQREIMNVCMGGFSAGVHGIEFLDFKGMLDEYKTFEKISGQKPAGIRMHYVRFDDSTFENLSHVGYAFDSTEFDKKNKGTRKNPYKVGSMWEFPLTIMDGYLPQQFEKAKQTTLDILEDCKLKHINYVSVLFHDYQFCEDYKEISKWYKWLIQYVHESAEYSFSSYHDAINQLETTSNSSF